ncbi:AAA family ATPase [Novosphingobium beihaiensis]|uniref:AAA family ATPase n=1 Tax=Novosphingobium beihaiensis TaxID=2930389 RepID=A0ABT0BNA5_9SPHN|nr:AAA family ATPase [Novosphingobium beihaiensis]MCJ2186519.1 AAA family ATPase [Novosphingobium beihaiensis]
MHRFVAISGCSGGGKSTLLAELRRRGHAVVEEPGRRIIAEELQGSGQALPWVDIEAFAERAMAMALRDRAEAASLPGWIFFDRGLIDAAAALEHASGRPVLQDHASERYNRRMFMAPPWPEIYETDDDRQHGLKEAIAEYERLLSAYDHLGYDICLLPKASVAERADFVLDTLARD